MIRGVKPDQQLVKVCIIGLMTLNNTDISGPQYASELSCKNLTFSLHMETLRITMHIGVGISEEMFSDNQILISS